MNTFLGFSVVGDLGSEPLRIMLNFSTVSNISERLLSTFLVGEANSSFPEDLSVLEPNLTRV